MFSTVLSAALHGMNVEFVQAEADISNGLPMFHMVGYLSSEVKEAGERIKTAIRNAGIQVPAKKIVINLSPANVKKRGAAFDLPIAIAILGSLGVIKERKLDDMLVLGELSLDGRTRKVAGILPIIAEAKAHGYKRCMIPKENALEGALVEGIQVIGVENLREVYDYLNNAIEIKPEKVAIDKTTFRYVQNKTRDYSDIKGQAAIKRATEVAVAGQHNILFIGPPGAGKTMIAKRIPSIFPPLTLTESMEITKIYSISGMLPKGFPLITKRPFREVHHTTTKTALVGGGAIPVPGEISLANGGVLFLDELAEFQKPVLEVLRQPLEEHRIQIVRSRGTYVFPANFMLVAALNPCPCGNFPDLNKCTCTEHQIQTYLGKISQPFLDRMDICVEAPKVEYEALNSNHASESSEEIRKRVCKAREIQRKRYQEMTIHSNAELGIRELKTYCKLNKEGEQLLKRAYARLGLTARIYHKILRVARTIADLEGAESIAPQHVKEAIGYRTMDKKYWGHSV